MKPRTLYAHDRSRLLIASAITRSEFARLDSWNACMESVTLSGCSIGNARSSSAGVVARAAGGGGRPALYGEARFVTLEAKGLRLQLC